MRCWGLRFDSNLDSNSNRSSHEEPVHLSHSFLLHVGQRVAVNVHRDTDLAVAEQLLDNLWMSAQAQQKSSGTVAEIMEADTG